MSSKDNLDELFWGSGGMGFSLAELRARADVGGAQPHASVPAGPAAAADQHGDAGLLWGCGGLGLPRHR